MKVQHRKEFQRFMADREQKEDHHRVYREQVKKDRDRMRDRKIDRPRPELDVVNAEIDKELDKQHADILHHLDLEHTQIMAALVPPTVYEVSKNEDGLPLVLRNGVIILPGHFYVDHPENPFGISPDEMKQQYVEVS